MTEIEIEVLSGPVLVLPVPATAVDVLLLNGPCVINGWSLRDATPVSTSSGVPVATGAAAAAGNGSALLPVNDALSQFTLAFGAVLTANTLAVTVTNAQGGTLTYAIPLAVGQNSPFVASFPTPLEAVAGQQITVTVTGNVNSPTVNITAYGVASPSPTVVELQDGNNPLGEVTLSLAGVDTRWYGGDGLRVRNRVNLHVISGTIVGAVYARYDRLTG